MTERQWELYRLSVVEKMPESDYKTAVLAGIAHKLTMLDRMETLQFPTIEDAARTLNGKWTKERTEPRMETPNQAAK